MKSYIPEKIMTRCLTRALTKIINSSYQLTETSLSEHQEEKVRDIQIIAYCILSLLKTNKDKNLTLAHS